MTVQTIYVTYSGGSMDGTHYTADGTNDQDAINSALNLASANPGSTVIMRGPHTYNIRDQIKVGSSTTWTAESGVILKVPDYACGGSVTYGTSGAWCAFPDGSGVITKLTTTVTGIEIYGFEIDGNCQHQYTKLGLAHGTPSSAGSGVERLIQFQGSSGYECQDINIHDMNIHDAFGEALQVTFCKNVRFHDNICSNHQHEGVYYKAITGSGNAIYNNSIAGITSGCIRCDSCQNVNIYDNDCTSYDGPNNNGAPKFGHSGMQIANNASYSILTNNINVYNNTISGPNVAGIWMNDVKKTAGTNAQTVNIYNNTINNGCGWASWAYWSAGIGIQWGNGLTIEYNDFDGCYCHTILIYGNITSSATSIKINNNNIKNTRANRDGTTPTDGSTPKYTTPVGYGICNVKSTTVTAAISYTYFSGNLKGPIYPTNLIHTNDVTTLNGLKPGTSTGGSTGGGSTGGGTTGDVLPEIPVRYIPQNRAVRESLAEYFLRDYTVYDENNREITAYINQYPLRIVGFSKKTTKVIASNKPPGIDGVNLGDFGFEGGSFTVTCRVSSLDDAWQQISAWKRRSPAILEPGGVYSGWFLSGIMTTPESDIRFNSEEVPERGFTYTVQFETDTPFFRSTTERIRSRKITNSLQWSADDIYTGNQLSNPSLESWLAGMEDVAPDRWNYETAGMQMSGETAHDGANSVLITGNGTDADRGSFSQPVKLEAGFSYLLSAYGAVSGLTQGQLVVELEAGGGVVSQLVWDDVMDWYQQQIIITPSLNMYDAVVRVHLIGTANAEALVYCDDMYFGRMADIEIAALGNSIQTLGYEDAIPDFEVSAVQMSNVTSSTETAGVQATNVNNGASTANSYSTTYTTWRLVLTTSLPQLSGGGKYRIDQVSCTLAAYVDTTYKAYLEPRLYAPSLNGGVEQALATGWETTSLTAVAFSEDITGKTSANEAIEIRWYAKVENNSNGHKAVPKLLTVKYTPLTTSTAYSYVAGTQVVTTRDDEDATNATSFTALYTQTIPALSNNATCRLDGLSAQLAVSVSGNTATMQVTAQATGWQGGAETVIVGPWAATSVDPSFTTKSSVSSQTNFGNGPVTIKWYLKSTTGTDASCRNMTIKYTPMIPQSAPDLDAGSATISIYNVDDPTVVLDMCNTLLPKCKFAINSDYSGSFEMSEDFSDNLYSSIITDNGSTTPVYSAANRTLELPAGSYLTYLFDTKYSVTGKPFIQVFVVSGIPQMWIADYDPITKGPVEWYAADSNTATALEDTAIYRELDNAANLSLAGKSKYFVCIKPPTSGTCTIGSIYHYADLVTMDAPRPKIFANGGVNTFAAILNGNPCIVTIRYRDTNMVI